jgi:peptide/nickel transport system permease protein
MTARVAAIAAVAALYASCLWLAPAGSLAALPAHAAFLPPSLAHPLGTDDLGRDLLAALAQGGRTSLLAAGPATLLALGLGLAVGLLAGLGPPAVDEATMRLAEILGSLPLLLLAVLAASLFGGSTANLALLVGLTRWPVVARLVRAEALALRGREFLRAAWALGATPWQVARRHLLPNVLGPALAAAGIVFGAAVLTEASLAFLGLGDPDAASWGRMAAAGFGFLDRSSLIWGAPVAMVVLVSGGIAVIADPVQR